jgi:hypothetical protein
MTGHCQLRGTFTGAQLQARIYRGTITGAVYRAQFIQVRNYRGLYSTLQRTNVQFRGNTVVRRYGAGMHMLY